MFRDVKLKGNDGMEKAIVNSLPSSNSTRIVAYVEISNKTQIRNHKKKKKKWDQRGLL